MYVKDLIICLGCEQDVVVSARVGVPMMKIGTSVVEFNEGPFIGPELNSTTRVTMIHHWHDYECGYC